MQYIHDAVASDYPGIRMNASAVCFLKRIINIVIVINILLTIS